MHYYEEISIFVKFKYTSTYVIWTVTFNLLNQKLIFFQLKKLLESVRLFYIVITNLKISSKFVKINNK